MLAQVKVPELGHPTLADEHVCGLDIAVHDTPPVQIVQSQANVRKPCHYRHFRDEPGRLLLVKGNDRSQIAVDCIFHQDTAVVDELDASV